MPDVMPLAKGLANGVPIGACLTAGKAANAAGNAAAGAPGAGRYMIGFERALSEAAARDVAVAHHHRSFRDDADRGPRACQRLYDAA
mgnify:CR=1 FL=1